VAGCGPTAGTVSGEVTYAGVPVENGHIMFLPADGRGKDAGGSITAGRYEASGLPPGLKIVKVIGVKKVNFASTSEEMMRRGNEARQAGNYEGLVDPADTIPDDAEGNNVQVDIQAGQNKFDFHLKPRGKGSPARVKAMNPVNTRCDSRFSNGDSSLRHEAGSES
jgi:hypothetical protein